VLVVGRLRTDPTLLVTNVVTLPSGGDGGDDMNDDGLESSGAAEEASSGGGETSHPALPRTAASVAYAYLNSGPLGLVGAGAIGAVVLLAGLYVVLAALVKQRRRGLMNDILVDRTTAKATSVYSLEPLQDKLPVPVVPKTIATSLGTKTLSKSSFLPPTLPRPTTSRGQGLPQKRIVGENVRMMSRRYSNSSIVLPTYGTITSCSSIGSSVV
jgi:hypothetical protein